MAWWGWALVAISAWAVSVSFILAFFCGASGRHRAGMRRG